MIESKAETVPTASVSGRLEKMNSIRMRRGRKGIISELYNTKSSEGKNIYV